MVAVGSKMVTAQAAAVRTPGRLSSPPHWRGKEITDSTPSRAT